MVFREVWGVALSCWKVVVRGSKPFMSMLSMMAGPTTLMYLSVFMLPTILMSFPTP